MNHKLNAGLHASGTLSCSQAGVSVALPGQLAFFKAPSSKGQCAVSQNGGAPDSRQRELRVCSYTGVLENKMESTISGFRVPGSRFGGFSQNSHEVLEAVVSERIFFIRTHFAKCRQEH